MPPLTAVFWNIQNFGATGHFKANYSPLAHLVAQVMQATRADVLFVQELEAPAIAHGHLELLQHTLNKLPAPQDNWYFEWIMGAVDWRGGARRPWERQADLHWDRGHHEGYAVFWNQNLAKFRVVRPPPRAPGLPNRQSQVVRTRGLVPGSLGTTYGLQVPTGGIAVPPDPAYRIPAGTYTPAAIQDGGPSGGGSVVVGGRSTTPAPIVVHSGTVLPPGLRVGDGGVRLTAATHNLEPVVVPGRFELTDELALPAPGHIVVPDHALSLVLTGRDTRVRGRISSAVGDIGSPPAFTGGATTEWQLLYFTQGEQGIASFSGPRRPAFITIEANGVSLREDRLIPLIAYHAPSAEPAASGGMLRASWSRPLYQAFDHDAPTGDEWVDTSRAVIGGDFNAGLDHDAYPYAAFTRPIERQGAGCVAGVDAPAPPPPVPPTGNPPTQADNPLNKTVVQLREGFIALGPEIVVAELAGYRRRAIDNVFHRGFYDSPAAGVAPVHDLLPAVSGFPGGIPRWLIRLFIDLPVFDAIWWAQELEEPLPTPAPPVVRDAARFVDDLSRGAFEGWGPGVDPAARRAAEFVRLCVSDHQPIVFTADL